MKKILFVDDDPQLLAALRNVLHRERARWDMVFANSGESAIELLAATRFDAIVCDMRMPGIDGVEVLCHVRDTSPDTVRIMLSGSADPQDVDRANAVVEVLLGKPCPSRVLRETLERLMDRAAA